MKDFILLRIVLVWLLSVDATDDVHHWTVLYLYKTESPFNLLGTSPVEQYFEGRNIKK